MVDSNKLRRGRFWKDVCKLGTAPSVPCCICFAAEHARVVSGASRRSYRLPIGCREQPRSAVAVMQSLQLPEINPPTEIHLSHENLMEKCFAYHTSRLGPFWWEEITKATWKQVFSWGAVAGWELFHFASYCSVARSSRILEVLATLCKYCVLMKGIALSKFKLRIKHSFWSAMWAFTTIKVDHKIWHPLAFSREHTPLPSAGTGDLILRPRVPRKAGQSD